MEWAKPRAGSAPWAVRVLAGAAAGRMGASLLTPDFFFGRLLARRVGVQATARPCWRGGLVCKAGRMGASLLTPVFGLLTSFRCLASAAGMQKPRSQSVA